MEATPARVKETSQTLVAFHTGNGGRAARRRQQDSVSRIPSPPSRPLGKIALTPHVEERCATIIVTIKPLLPLAG